MKRYIEPEMKIAMFRAESVVTVSYTEGVDTWWDENKEKGNSYRTTVDFNEMVQFVL